MCGIFCVLNTFCDNCDNLISQLRFEKNIKNRGPNSYNFKVLSYNECSLAFAASVLWLQGDNLCEQPIEDPDSVLCYNGDIFDGLDNESQKVLGDTNLFHQALKKHVNTGGLKELSQLHGPYAFIFFNKVEKKIYFARDLFGRRSLLFGKNKENDTLIFTSVAKRHTEFDFVEVPAIGVFSFDITTFKFEINFWQYNNKNFITKLREMESFLNMDIAKVQQNMEVDSYCSNFKENDNLLLLKSLSSCEQKMDVFKALLTSPTWLNNVLTLKDLLENAVCKRISTQPPFCGKCIVEKQNCKHSTTGVLFSGGLDCAILALICNMFVGKDRPIDLINVSFDEANNYLSPDRITALQTLEELKECCPYRTWNLIEVNVPQSIVNEERQHHIADLIYPLNTILDDSLGCALWFASRGISQSFQTSCRVLLVGMGADEIFGGYTRHRAAFKRHSWKGLQESLEEDWQNLPYRNLGRDDRVVSDNGRQLRTPFLDENVVKFARNLQCYERTCPTEDLPQGVGEKILLRSLAYHLGLKNAASLKKRALQFGSRIANPKENAHEVSPRLLCESPKAFK